MDRGRDGEPLIPVLGAGGEVVARVGRRFRRDLTPEERWVEVIRVCGRVARLKRIFAFLGQRLKQLGNDEAPWRSWPSRLLR